jgi:hypothetical protein
MKRTRLAPSLEEISQSYIDWITKIPIVPSFPYRNSYRLHYNQQNSQYVFQWLFLFWKNVTVWTMTSLIVK